MRYEQVSGLMASNQWETSKLIHLRCHPFQVQVSLNGAVQYRIPYFTKAQCFNFRFGFGFYAAQTVLPLRRKLKKTFSNPSEYETRFQRENVVSLGLCPYQNSKQRAECEFFGSMCLSHHQPAADGQILWCTNPRSSSGCCSEFGLWFVSCRVHETVDMPLMWYLSEV